MFRTVALFVLLSLLLSPSGWAFEKPKFFATVRADIGGRHLEKDVHVFWSNNGAHISEVRWPYATLLKAKVSGSPDHGCVTLGGNLLEAPVTLYGGTELLRFRPRPSEETAIVLTSALGLHAFMSLGDGHQNKRCFHQKKNASFLYEPGVGKSARIVVRDKKDWLEVLVAPAGQRYQPLPSRRQTSSKSTSSSRS